MTETEYQLWDCLVIDAMRAGRTITAAIQEANEAVEARRRVSSPQFTVTTAGPIAGCASYTNF